MSLLAFCASKVFEGPLTPNRREYFSGITKLSFKQLVSDRINERLKSAMSGVAIPDAVIAQESSPSASEETRRESLVETTAVELEGFYVMKSLLREVVDLNRIVYRDTQSYFGILLDDNNRKPIARLYFNRPQKYIGVFDEQRKEERIAIQDLNDIYQHGDKMRRVFAFYESEKGSEGTVEAQAEVE